MDQIMSRISLYHNLYFVCLGATILFLAISIFLFFYLDVKNCIGFLTGRQARKEIERLNVEGVIQKTSSKKEVSEEKKHSVKFRKIDDIPKITITKKLEDGREEKTELLCEMEEKSYETTLLKEESKDFIMEREILMIHTKETIE